MAKNDNQKERNGGFAKSDKLMLSSVFFIEWGIV